MKNIHDVLKGPCLTEKANLQHETMAKAVFEVHPDANKIEIKQAVERMFKVKVATVRTTRVPGRKKRVGRHIGHTSDWKKAYVTLSEGEISFVDEL
jgi:large subunit ribosomal protein L23